MKSSPNFPLLGLITSLNLAFCSFAVHADTSDAGKYEPESWPYPEDIPKVVSVDIGMASDRPYDISRFLLARGPGGAGISPTGEHLAFVSGVTGNQQLWVMPSAGGQAKQLTFGNGITSYQWHPDGQRLLYAADNNGDEREAYYLISVDGTKESLALPHSPAYRQFGSFNETGDQFTYASTERNGRDFDLYSYDLSKATSKMIYQAEFGFFPSAWRPGKNEILVSEVRGEDGNNLYLLNMKNGKLKTLFKPEISARYSDFNWRGDGEGFFFSSNQNGEMKTLQYHNVKTGKTSTIVSNDFDIEDVNLCQNDKYLLWTVNQKGFEQLYQAKADGSGMTQHKLPVGNYSISCTDTGIALVRVNSPYTPGTLMTLDLASGDFETLLEPDMAGIDPSLMVMPDAVSFPARDGVELQGLLYLPTTSSVEKPPLVVDIHGGPTAQSRATWQPLVQYLLGKGIAVLDINVRGSTGFGKTYARLDNQEKRLDSVRDLVDALVWLEQDGRVDTKRAAAMGGSYGGYMVNAVMGAYPDAFKAGASFVGVADWVRALQTASPGLKASDRIEYGDIREQKWQDFYAENSPINTVNKIKAPMFYEHGVNDPRDPVTESDTMVKALRDKEIPVTYLRYPDEGHSIRKLPNRITFFRELADFLETHL